MKNKKFQAVAVAALAAILLIGCGPSEEKLAEAEEARTLLIQSRDAAQETYLDITDDSNKATLDELSQKVAEIEAVDFNKMSDKKIDELLPTINELTASYQNMGKEMSDVLQVETETREERAKHEEASVYFVNKTGLNLTKIVLHDLTRDTYSDNYLKDGSGLLDGYTLLGVTLDIYSDSSDWEFVVTDEGGTDHTIACGNLKGFNKETITLSFNGEEEAETDEGAEAASN